MLAYGGLMSSDIEDQKKRDRIKFAERLKQVRLKRELNQQELGKLSGMEQSAIAHFEGARRAPSFANVRSLAKALNISSDFLLGRSDELEGATTAFRGESKLSQDDRAWIQRLIDDRISNKE